MMLVDDGNIIPHGDPVEHFQSYTKFDGDDLEGGEEETNPLPPKKHKRKSFIFIFSDSEETQTTDWEYV